MKRLLVPTAALWWGLQFALLNPALALLLVSLLDASPADVGWVLAAYNASGFLAALAIPAYADRRRDYLRPLLVSAVLTVVLAGALAIATALPVVVVSLVVFGGPAGVGVTLLFAHLRQSSDDPSAVVNTRAVVSFAWIAGPPVATFLIAWSGPRAVLVALAGIAVLNVVTTAAMLTARNRAAATPPAPKASDGASMSRGRVATVVAVFVVLQATNATVVSVMGVYVTGTLGLDVMWSGVALSAAAALEIPALLAIGRLSRRVPDLTLMASGCLAGIAYYAAMAALDGPVALIAVQVLNAWFFGVMAGTGLNLFQRIIPRAGLASGIYTNTRRVGAIVSGPLIGIAALTGYRGVFVACAALTVVALATIGLVARQPVTRSTPSESGPGKERPISPLSYR